MDKHQLGEVIRERRKLLNINQPTLALLAGIGINTLVAIEKGNGNPTIDKVIMVLDILGLTLDVKLKGT